MLIANRLQCAQVLAASFTHGIGEQAATLAPAQGDRFYFHIYPATDAFQ